jgi:K+-sensing histidine kinase KdpD
MEKILVCVTVQEECVRLIRFGHDLALKNQAELHVLHVSQDKAMLGTPENAAVLNTLMSLAREAEAEMCILCEPDAAAAIARYAGELGAKELILGPNRTQVTARVKALLPEGVAVTNVE